MIDSLGINHVAVDKEEKWITGFAEYNVRALYNKSKSSNTSSTDLRGNARGCKGVMPTMETIHVFKCMCLHYELQLKLDHVLTRFHQERIERIIRWKIDD